MEILSSLFLTINKFTTMTKKVKFTQDFTTSNKVTHPKGSTRTVTSKMALFLEKNGFAKIVVGKEEKEAEERETK